MKQIFFLLIIMHHNLILPNEPIEVEDMPCAIILNFNVSNVDNSHNVNNARINTNQNLNQVEKNSEGAALAIQDIKSFIGDATKNYKWHIGIAFAVGSYGLLCYCIAKGNHYLKRSDLWASWTNAEEITAQELFREIKNRYKKDFASSLVLFIKEIDQEEKNIRWYQSLYHWARYLHIQKLLPFDSAVYENFAQKLERIMHYRRCIEAI